MQRFLYDIFNRVEDDRFALEFRGRARRMLERAERGKRKKKRGKRPGVNGNWENREKPGRGSKFHESLKFRERGKKIGRAHV